MHALSGSSGLPRGEVPKHLEHRPPAEQWTPACLPAPAMACPPLALLLLGALLAGEPSQGLAHLGVGCKTARGSRRPLRGSESQWAGGTVSEGAVRGRGDLASVSPLVSDQIARVPLDSDSGGSQRLVTYLGFQRGSWCGLVTAPQGLRDKLSLRRSPAVSGRRLSRWI